MALLWFSKCFSSPLLGYRLLGYCASHGDRQENNRVNRIDTIDMYHAIQIANKSLQPKVIGNLMPWQKKTNWTQRVEGEHSCSKKISRAALIDLMHSDGVIQNDKSLLNCYKFPRCQWIVRAMFFQSAAQAFVWAMQWRAHYHTHTHLCGAHKVKLNGALPFERPVWGGARGDAEAFTPNKQIE